MRRQKSPIAKRKKTKQNETNTDGTKWVECRIENIDANFGISKSGKSDKVAFGRVWFKDAGYRNVTVQLNAYRTPPTN